MRYPYNRLVQIKLKMLGKSQKELAAAMGISAQRLSVILSRPPVSLEKKQQIDAVLSRWSLGKED